MAASALSARRYAEAVFDIADEQERFIPWANDLQTIAGFAGEADVAKIIASARVPKDEKLRLLTAGLRGQIGDEAMNLVRILNDREKVGLIPDIARIYGEKVDERRGVAHAVVTTAVPLSADERDAVAARLSAITGKAVDVTPAVDPAIIGGVIARIGDQLIDGSTRTRLKALRRSLEGAGR
ncbi:MAG: F0F1 ATP synthase subunit delta [Dehalococcoidia bacterium]|nr:F0F1 ATP synthase subunit delta [Dehalococcoidia bacterium]